MYNEKVFEIFNHPKNAGAIINADAVGKVGNPQCGDVMKIFLKIGENGVITEAKFKTFGCAAAIASSDITCDLIRGKTVDQALKLDNKDVVDALGGLPPQKIHCSVLAKEAVAAAIKDYHKQKTPAKAAAKPEKTAAPKSRK
jgi:nitrogen fixation NifU-like protein